MASNAIRECLEAQPNVDTLQVPLLLCVAERDRPGRTKGLEEQLFAEIQAELGCEFPIDHSLVIPQGRFALGPALDHARTLIGRRHADQVLIAATDSLITAQTLKSYDHRERLLTPKNSNGFLPAEGAGALLVAPADGSAQLVCVGLGFGMEDSHIESDQPLRADGLTAAIRDALSEARLTIDELAFRIADLSGEQYYFKEAALAPARLIRKRQEMLEMWHPAECIGEAGALMGVLMVAIAEAACRKAYTKGQHVLLHVGNDSGRRAAVILKYARE